MEHKKLTIEDINEVAKLYNLEPAVIYAVIKVESRGEGFYYYNPKKGKQTWDNELLVRFEGHWFRRFTKGIYDKTHPKLSYSNWRLGFKYALPGRAEFGRFFESFKLNKEAAWKASSWGMFQVMGEHGEILYGSTLNMLVEFYKGEKQQLEAFIKFCESKGILDDLREKNWSGFARIYNGSGYKVNKYHIKLEQNYKNFNNKL